MASLQAPTLRFHQQVANGDDPGMRVIELPQALPQLADDFDWDVRDFDSFRDFMLSELQAQFPQRQRWTSADMEVVLIEALASVLDQLADMADRTATESCLFSARRADSVAQWLQLIGANADAADYRENPLVMESERQRGPGSIHRQERMVSLQDYQQGLAQHPLVFRARARQAWSGSWSEIWVSVMLQKNLYLDEPPPHSYAPAMVRKIEAFHQSHKLYLAPDWRQSTTVRDILTLYLEAYRTLGQAVYLEDVVNVGVEIFLKVQLRPQYFHSEMRYEIMNTLGRGPGGFFEPGRLNFSQDIPASDVHEVLMNLVGIEHVTLLTFRRYDDRGGEQVQSEVRIASHEVAVCDNDSQKPQRGQITLILEGGRTG